MTDSKPHVGYYQAWNENPVVQFRSPNQFVADLAAGVVDTVYHDVGEEPNRHWISSFRAAVVTAGNVAHIASLSFHRPALRAVDGRGRERQVEYEEQLVYQTAEHAELLENITGRLAQAGILSLREGLIQLPYWATVVYARRPQGMKNP